jgi:lysophospholipase L1-like esterase
MRHRAILTIALSAALTLSAGVSADASPRPTQASARIATNTHDDRALRTTPRHYYLALGDSIAYGFQTQKALAGLPPEAFDTGFVDLFGARLRRLRPSIVTVNYSCPGESTPSFNTPCVWKASGHALHDDYSGSQLDAAITFLKTHRGRVSPISLSLNGNDIDAFVQSCAPGDSACIQAGAPAAIAAYQQRLRAIVAKLRRAAPDAEIILTGSYDPNVGAFPIADPLFAAVNSAESHVASHARAVFADPFPVFNPQGDLEAETAAICSLTLVCSQADSHPSDAGYQALADVVWAAAAVRSPRPR